MNPHCPPPAPIRVYIDARTSALLATQSDEDARIAARTLTDLGYYVRRVQSYREAIREMNKCRFTLVLTDVHLGDGSWKDLLSQTAEMVDPPRLMLLAGGVDPALCAEAVNLGAYDVLARPLDGGELRRVGELASGALLPLSAPEEVTTTTARAGLS